MTEQPGIWPTAAEEAAHSIMKAAEARGLIAIAQFFAVQVCTASDGLEFALAVGPMRYLLGNAVKDAEAATGETTVSVIGRYCDPSDADSLKDWERLQGEAEAERAGSKF